MRRYCLLALLLPLLAACEVTIGDGDDLDDEQRDLNRARRDWFDAGITDYDYVIQNDCFCGSEIRGPVLVEVRRGAVARLRYVSSGASVPPAFIGYFPPVEGLFGIVQEAIDDQADDLDVIYDSAFRFPERIDIDYRFRTADDELTVRVFDFVWYP